MSSAVTICITVTDPVMRRLARYGFEEALVRFGASVRIAEGEPTEGAVVYGPIPASWRGPMLSYDPRCYDPTARFAAIGSLPLWAPEGAELENVDLIGGLARLLTLADETQIDERSRDRREIFSVADLPAARGHVRLEPLVEYHSTALYQQLRSLAPELSKSRPLWPTGRRYAVMVTHDTDAVALNAPLEILFNGAKAILRRDAIRARMAWDGLTRKAKDPLLGFETWAEMERAAGLRSAFYLFGRGKVWPHINDCRSTVFNRAINWDVLRSLANEGWEFGLHPPIRAKALTDEFVWGKQALEERLRRPVHGLRHHYLALDWRQPHRTFRKHLSAGFRYDASIGWHDDAGFRAGTCLPYRPFDPERGTALDMYELPTTLQDWHVISDGGNVAAALRRAFGVAQKVRQVGGILNLDWHTEAAVDDYCYRNQRTTLALLLAQLQAGADAWFVTPWELTQYWHERLRVLLPDGV